MRELRWKKMNATEIFEEWLKSEEGKRCLATGEYTQEFTREQSLRISFLLGIKAAESQNTQP